MTAYRERLLPRWWAWLVAGGLVTMVSVAYGAALGASAGWLVALGLGGLAVTLLWITAPVIAIDADGVHVARAHLPASAIGSAEPVTREDIARLRGPGGESRLFVALRPWSAPGGVLLHVADPQDPHPAWLFSSRHPTRVTQALAATMTVEAPAPADPPEEDA